MVFQHTFDIINRYLSPCRGSRILLYDGRAGWGAKFCLISSALYKHNVLDKFWRYQFDSAEKFSESRKNDDEKVFFYSLAWFVRGGRILKMADLEIEF